MKLGMRVGPFYTSTRHVGCGPWVGAFFALLIIVGLYVTYPAVMGLVTVALVGVGVWSYRRVRRDRE